MSSPSYPVTTIAKLFNLTERRVQQLAKEGIIPKPVKGKYDLIGCVRGYIGYLQERALGKDVAPADSHIERARLLKAQADKAELEVQIMNRSLIPMEEVEAAWSQLVMRFRSRVLAIPPQAAQKVLSLKEFLDIEQVLKEMIYSALDELSRYDPDEEYALGCDESSETGGPSTDATDQPVGR